MFSKSKDHLPFSSKHLRLSAEILESKVRDNLRLCNELWQSLIKAQDCMNDPNEDPQISYGASCRYEELRQDLILARARLRLAKEEFYWEYPFLALSLELAPDDFQKEYDKSEV